MKLKAPYLETEGQQNTMGCKITVQKQCGKGLHTEHCLNEASNHYLSNLALSKNLQSFINALLFSVTRLFISNLVDVLIYETCEPLA